MELTKKHKIIIGFIGSLGLLFSCFPNSFLSILIAGLLAEYIKLFRLALPFILIGFGAYWIIKQQIIKVVRNELNKIK